MAALKIPGRKQAPGLSNMREKEGKEGAPDGDRSIPSGERRPIEDLERLYRKYAARVFAIAVRIAGNQHAAEDITQDVFIQAYEHRADFKGESAPYTWLYRITVNLSINWVKGESRRRTALRPVRSRAGADPADALVQEETRAELLKLLEGLPVEYRACLVLKDVEGLSYSTIAEILEIPEGTAASRVARARQRLTEMLRRRAT